MRAPSCRGHAVPAVRSVAGVGAGRRRAVRRAGHPRSRGPGRLMTQESVKRPCGGLQSSARASTMTAPLQLQVTGYRKQPAPLDSPEIVFIWRKPELQPESGKTPGAGSNREAKAAQRPTAPGPFPQKVNTRTGVGSRARVAPLARGERNTAGPTRTVQSGSGWWHRPGGVPEGDVRTSAARPATPVRATDTSRPGAHVMVRAWVLQTSDSELVENLPHHLIVWRKRAIFTIRGGVHHHQPARRRGSNP